MDGLECTGDHLPSPAARPQLRNRRSRARPELVSPIVLAWARWLERWPCLPTSGDPLTEPPVETARGKAAAAGRAPVDVEELHRLVLQSLDDDQAQEVVSIPLAGKS